jgi:predicted O-methyltransferase YrrM
MTRARAEGLEALRPHVEGKPAAMVALAVHLQQEGNRAAALDLCTRALDLAPGDGHVRAIAADVMTTGVPDWHFAIVRDQARNDAFDAALRRAVFPGCRVLEIGAGTGLLAMMAARAGAGSVVTCESEPAVAMVAQRVIARNGYADRVRVVAKHSTGLDVAQDLGGRADVLVAEIVSNDMLTEQALPALEHAIAHLVVPGGAVIPARGCVRIALAEDRKWRQAQLGSVSGFDLTPFNRLAAPFRQIGVGDPRLELRSDPADLFTFAFASGGPFPEERRNVALFSHGGAVNGIAQWIALDLDAGHRYENVPRRGSKSAWAILFHPIAAPLTTVPGQPVRVSGRHDRESLTIWEAA